MCLFRIHSAKYNLLGTATQVSNDVRFLFPFGCVPGVPMSWSQHQWCNSFPRLLRLGTTVPRPSHEVEGDALSLADGEKRAV
jgi:hypothetical protein